MKFLINSTSAVPGTSLHLKISGFSIELSDVSGFGKVTVVEDLGKVSIEVLPSIDEGFLPAIDNKPLLEKASLLKNMQEAEDEENEKPLTEFISDVQNISPDLLFKKLVTLRRQISQEVNLPPYIIFHDTTLKDMVSKMPVDLDEMKEVSGVGITKLEKYGVRFVDVIKEYLADSA